MGITMAEQKGDTGLPGEILRLLGEGGVRESEILHSARTDMNAEGVYADGWLVLTGDRLCAFQAPPDPGKIRYYKGYGTRREESLQAGKDYSPAFYALKDLENLRIETGVGCNLLLAGEGEETGQIAMFTNLHRGAVSRLVRHAQCLLEGREYEAGRQEEEYCPKCGRMYPDSARGVCPHCMNKRHVFVRVLGYFKPYRVQFAVMILATVMTALLNLVWPYLNGTVLYDRILGRDEGILRALGLRQGEFLTALLLLVLAMAATKIVLLLFQILQGVLTAQMVPHVVRDMKKDVFSQMSRLSIGFYKSRQTGSLMTRVMSDADRVTGFFVDGAPFVLIHGFTIAATLAVMGAINLPMTLITLLLFPVLVAVSVYLRPKIWIMFGKRHRAERSLNSGVNDNLTGARVVKSFGQEKRETERFRENNKRLRDAEIAINYRQNYFRIVYEGAQSIATMGVWALGVYYLMKGSGSMDLGVLITFVGYVGQLQGPMGFFSRVHNWWADSMNSAQRLFEIIDSVPQVQEAENPVRLEHPKGEIDLEGVTFGYEINRPVLKNVSVHIPAGSMLGVVGRSGAGKTTLVNLISRLYDVQEGSIRLDGVDVRDLSFRDLRRNVAMVSQETYIFMGTVAENIAYADKNASPAEIMRAAKLAGAHDFIMRMPDGYDTRIGASGRELSGGERQRISIARAILADPRILILDEATASVDTETERLIQKSLGYLVQGRTTISIAHRLSTLRDADYLIVLDEGEITERGTHEELEEMRGTYYKLMELQTKALAMREEFI